MRCQNCNYNNKDTVSFCIMCGTKLINQDNIRKQAAGDSSKKLAYIVSDNEIVDENLLLSTAEKHIGELIPYTCGQVMDKRCFKYNILDLITMKEFTSKIVKREEFLTVLLNLLNAITGLQARGLALNNMFLKTSQIFIDKRNLMVKMVCIPVSNRKQEKDLGALIKEIILSSEFDYNENCKYVKELLKYFNESREFNINVFQGLIEKAIEEGDDEPVSARMQNSYVPQRSGPVNNGPMNAGRMGNASMGRASMKNDFYVEEDSFESEGTTLLEDDEYGTTLLGEEDYAYLVRVNTNEKIVIDKPVFKIGKDRNSSDYCISDNLAVSRKHVQVVNKNGDYFIIDLGSTNHTYINGKRIRDKVEVKLEHENLVKLGNEEFEFYVY